MSGSQQHGPLSHIPVSSHQGGVCVRVYVGGHELHMRGQQQVCILQAIQTQRDHGCVSTQGLHPFLQTCSSKDASIATFQGTKWDGLALVFSLCPCDTAG